MKEKKKKNISSIFDNCHVTESQDIFLQRCGFARPGEPPPDSEPPVGVSPPLNDGIASHSASEESEPDSVIGSGYNEDMVDSHAIRFVSPEESVETVDLEDGAADQNVEDVARDIPVDKQVDGGDGEKSGNRKDPSSSGNRRDERLGSREKEGGGKKLKIPLRDVVKAIVMNSRNTEEEDKEEIEKTSFVQILMNKGFKFP